MGRLLLTLMLLNAVCLAEQPIPEGRWTAREGSDLELTLTLFPDGRATLQATHLRIMFVETTDGECIAHTFREEEPAVGGDVRRDGNRLIFHWATPPLPSHLFPQIQGESVWPFTLDDGDLCISLPDRRLVMRKVIP